MCNKILTISLAAYNVERYLRTALDSLLVSDDVLEKMEVLIIDDGSNDRTREIAQAYEDRYPNTFHVISKENGGWGSTVNYGIKNAHGKYFRLLDADDWYKIDNLPDYIQFLSSTDADIVLAPYAKVNQQDGTEVIVSRHSYVGNMVMRLSDFDIADPEDIHMHELSVKTALLQDNEIIISEKLFYTDNEFVFWPLLYSTTVSKFEKPIYCYRVGIKGQSVSMEGRRHYWKDGETVIRRLAGEYNRWEQKLPEITKRMLFLTLEKLAFFQMNTYLILDASAENRKRLITFDCWLQEECPDIYFELGNKSKVVRSLRQSKYTLYGMLHVYQKRKYAESK